MLLPSCAFHPFWYLDAKGGEFVLGERLLGCSGNLHGTRPSLLLYLVFLFLVLVVSICACLVHFVQVCNIGGEHQFYSLWLCNAPIIYIYVIALLVRSHSIGGNIWVFLFLLVIMSLGILDEGMKF